MKTNPRHSTTDLHLPDGLTRSRYASLRTFRRDGTAVDCPVWFAWSDDGSTIWFRSKADTAKIRRIVANPTIELRPCSWRGAVRPGAVVVPGEARVLDEARVLEGNPGGPPEATVAEQRLSDRYGWHWYTTPLFRIPFTHTSKVDLTLGEKVHLIRTRQSHGGSALVSVAVSGP